MDMDKTLSALNAQIQYARTHCAFYAKLPARPLSSVGELKTLPFTTAQDIALHMKEMLCCSPAAVRRMVTMQTSGTTGARKRLAFTEADLEDTVDFFHHGMNELCGAGDVVGIFMPGSNPDGLCDLLSRGIRRFGGIPLVYGPISDYADAARFCRQNRPAVLVGVPAQIRRLALIAPDFHPVRVLLSADYVSNAAVQTIERIWKCQALAHFGMTESGLGCAVETPARDGMHIRSGILLETTQDGELVLTTLRRQAMPLIRYRTGDLGKLLANGNLGAVYGRKEELSAPVSITALDEILFNNDGILDYRASVEENTLTIFAAAAQGALGQTESLLKEKYPQFTVQIKLCEALNSDGIHKRRIEYLSAQNTSD